MSSIRTITTFGAPCRRLHREARRRLGLAHVQLGDGGDLRIRNRQHRAIDSVRRRARRGLLARAGGAAGHRGENESKQCCVARLHSCRLHLEGCDRFKAPSDQGWNGVPEITPRSGIELSAWSPRSQTVARARWGGHGARTQYAPRECGRRTRGGVRRWGADRLRARQLGQLEHRVPVAGRAACGELRFDPIRGEA